VLQLENIKMEFGHNLLFEDVNISMNPGSRYGVVGANGSGKSTLLKIIAGRISPNQGLVRYPNKYNISFLEQNQFEFEETPILDVVLMGKANLWQLIREKRQIEKRDNISAENGTRLAVISENLATMNGYSAETKAGSILHGLGFQDEQLQNKMKTLSGGYKLRVLLAQCLFAEPDVLLLDEPNNHLDLQSIAWLGNYLENFKGIVVVVSHDHYFLNRVSTHILDIDYKTIKLYHGNYDHFKKKKKEERRRKEREIKKQEKKKKEMQEFYEKFKAKATKARQAISRKKQLEKMEEIEIKRSSRQAPVFQFPTANKSSQRILTVKNLCKSFNKNPVLKNLSIKIIRGDKIAILGPNGIGKTTLLKILLGEIEKDSGQIDWGKNIAYGYYAQDHSDQLPPNTTPYQWLEDQYPLESIGNIKGVLGKMLFAEEDMDRVTKSLSGGEAARLIFARLMLLKTNLLILDEPTNHLDLESIEALARELKKYPGTIIFVSHDRFFVEQIAEKIFEMTPTGYNYFSGTYQQFLYNKGEDYLNRDINLAVKDARPGRKKSSDLKKEYVRKRRSKKKEQARIEGKIQKTEIKIHNLERRLDEIKKQLFSDHTNQELDKLKELDQEQKKLENSLKKLMEIWEHQHQKFEKIEKDLQEFDKKIASLKS